VWYYMRRDTSGLYAACTEKGVYIQLESQIVQRLHLIYQS